MRSAAAPSTRRPRLAILSYSTGEFDARSIRIARSAEGAGYDVTMYARWLPGQPLVEERDGYRVVRADNDWRLAVPILRGSARRRLASRQATAAPPGPGAAPDRRVEAAPAATIGAAPAATVGAAPPATTPAAGPPRRGLLLPVRRAARSIRSLRRRVKHGIRRWQLLALAFPLRPLGWAAALEAVVEPADVWHGMWAGSLPALRRLSSRHGGRTIYDSRDVYLMSREFAALGWPLRPILAAAERRWARAVDRVITVNDAYASLVAAQLGVPRPAVVLNYPERWTPPTPAPDMIRVATGIPSRTSVVLYQGRMTTDRGIEQAMDAILLVPDAVLVLMGFGEKRDLYQAMAASPPYAGRVRMLPAVPPSELLAWSASADVLVMAIQPTTTNHRYTTPQKLWEAIAAGVPVVASDLPGMAEVVEPAGVGSLCDPTSPASIADAIQHEIGRPPAERAALRAHVLRVAHETYNWESQLDTLFGVYAGDEPPTAPSA